MSKCLVLASGGMDSSYMAAYQCEWFDEITLLYFNFCQPAIHGEIPAFHRVEKYLRNAFPAVQLNGRIDTLLRRTLPPSSDFVQGRNALFLWRALQIAVADGYDAIAVGFLNQISEEEKSYRDQRRGLISEYFSALKQVFSHCPPVDLLMFSELMDKKMLNRSITEKFPGLKELTYSCKEEKACGECPSCKHRLL